MANNSNKSLTSVNDIDELYDSGLIEADDGTFICPVCDKVYKTRKAAEAHLNKRDCYSMGDLFFNTPTELIGFDVYKNIISAINNKSRLNMIIFRKSPYYNGIMRYVAFAVLHEMPDLHIIEYLYWVDTAYSANNINGLVKLAISEDKLRQFRLFCQVYGDTLIESDLFWKRNKNALIEDANFFIRSIEKAHLAITYIDEEVLLDIYDNLPLDYKNRFDYVLEHVEKYGYVCV